MTHPTRQQQRERRERIILRLLDDPPPPYQQIAAEFDITRARVGQIAKFAGIVRRPAKKPETA